MGSLLGPPQNPEKNDFEFPSDGTGDSPIITINDGKIFGAKGSSVEIKTEDISLYVVDLEFKKDVIFRYKNKRQAVNLFFVLQGEIFGKEDGEGISYHFFPHEHMIRNTVQDTGFVGYKGGSRVVAILVEFSHEYIRKKLIGSKFPKIDSFINSKNCATPFSLTNGRVTREMATILEEIRTIDHETYLLKIFVESKSLELFRLQLEYFINRYDKGEYKHLLSQTQFDDLVIFLTTMPYAAIPKEDIAEKYGLSPAGLEKEVRFITTKPFMKYWKFLKMRYVRQELSTGKINIKEAAWQAGYNHTHHFSIAFKKEFGISPSEIKRSI